MDSLDISEGTDDDVTSTESFMKLLQEGSLTPERVLNSPILSMNPPDTDETLFAVQQQQPEKRQERQIEKPTKTTGRPPPSPFKQLHSADHRQGDDDLSNFIADHSNLEIPGSLLAEADASQSSPTSKSQGSGKANRKKRRRPREARLPPPGMEPQEIEQPSTPLGLRLSTMHLVPQRAESDEVTRINIDDLIATTRKAVQIDELTGSSISPPTARQVSFSTEKKAGEKDDGKEVEKRQPSANVPARKEKQSGAKEQWVAGSRAANLVHNVVDTFTGSTDAMSDEHQRPVQLRELEVRRETSASVVRGQV